MKKRPTRTAVVVSRSLFGYKEKYSRRAMRRQKRFLRRLDWEVDGAACGRVSADEE